MSGPPWEAAARDGSEGGEEMWRPAVVVAFCGKTSVHVLGSITLEDGKLGTSNHAGTKKETQ